MFIKVNSDFIVNTDHIEYIAMRGSTIYTDNGNKMIVDMIYMDNGNKVTIDEEHRDAVMSALVKINNMTIVR